MERAGRASNHGAAVGRAILFVALGTSVAACKTSPSSFCEHKLDLAEAYGKFDRKPALERCISEVEALRRAHPEETDCYLSCGRDKRTLPELVDCEKECKLVIPKSADLDVELPPELPPSDPSPASSPASSPKTSASAVASAIASTSAPASGATTASPTKPSTSASPTPKASASASPSTAKPATGTAGDGG